jgi:hypothetical protein
MVRRLQVEEKLLVTFKPGVGVHVYGTAGMDMVRALGLLRLADASVVQTGGVDGVIEEGETPKQEQTSGDAA